MHDTSPHRLRRWMALLLVALPLTSHAVTVRVRAPIPPGDTVGNLTHLWYKSGANWVAAVFSLTYQYTDAGTAYKYWDANLSVGGNYWFKATSGSTSGSTTIADQGSFYVPTSTPTSGQVITLTRYDTPAEWKLDWTVTNDTAIRRQYSVDVDGDGTTDFEFSLDPGESHQITGTMDHAPIGSGTVQTRGYLGDGQWGPVDVGPIPSTSWQQTYGSPTPGGTDHSTPPPPDPTSKDNPGTEYNTPSGGNLSESTFKTGIDSLRSTILQSSERNSTTVNVDVDLSPVVEAIEHHEATMTGAIAGAVTNWLGQIKAWWGIDDDPQGAADSAADAAEAAATQQLDDFKTSFDPFKNQITEKLGTPAPAMTSPDAFFIIPLGTAGTWGSINWNPLPAAGGWLAWGRAAILWTAWVIYTGWLVFTAFTALRSAVLAPQAHSSSSTPIVSAAIAVLLGVAACVLIGLVAGETLTGVYEAIGDIASQAGWMQEALAAPWFSLADSILPWATCLGLTTAAIGWHISIEGIAIGLSTALRRLAA